MSFLLGRAWRWAATLALGLTVAVVMGLAPGPLPGQGDSGAGHVRLMTYNIKAHRTDDTPGGFAALNWEVALHDPDIVVMQDASLLTAERAAAPDLAAAIYNGRQVYAHDQYIVASRHPLRDCKPGLIPYRGIGHSYVHCTETAHGVDFDLITAHFLSPRAGLNATRQEHPEGIADWRQNFDDRLTQAGELAADIAQRPAPWSSPVT